MTAPFVGAGSESGEHPAQPAPALPLQGPTKAECPCGCGLFGKPVKRRQDHIRGCPCRPCLNGRNSSVGKQRHRQFARKTGIVTAKFSTSEEEAWRDWARWEIKTGKQVDPVVTKFELARAQSEESRAIGDVRPFFMGVVPSQGARPSLVLMTAEDFARHIVPLVNEFGGVA